VNSVGVWLSKSFMKNSLFAPFSKFMSFRLKSVCKSKVSHLDDRSDLRAVRFLPPVEMTKRSKRSGLHIDWDDKKIGMKNHRL
jgi:hypothetical protein